MERNEFLMTTPEGTAWRFDAGSLCTEFLLTGGPGAFVVFEALTAPGDLGRWAHRSRLGLPVDTVATSAHDLRTARQLRDALWRLTWQAIGEQPLAADDLGVLNRAAQRPPLAPQLDGRDGRQYLLPTTATAVLSTVARDAIEVLANTPAGRLRECAAGDCRLVFVDTSRPGARRWCSMERCGNRHKVRALRSRRAPVNPDNDTEGDHS